MKTIVSITSPLKNLGYSILAMGIGCSRSRNRIRVWVVNARTLCPSARIYDMERVFKLDFHAGEITLHPVPDESTTPVSIASSSVCLVPQFCSLESTSVNPFPLFVPSQLELGLPSPHPLVFRLQSPLRFSA